MKTLKTKRVNILSCWNGLRHVAPREFQGMGEMEKTSTAIDTFKGAIPGLVEILLEGDRMNMDIQTGKIKGEEIMAKRAEFQKKANSLEDSTGKEEVEVSLEDDIFNTFFQQFEKWGKNWFQTVETILAFRKDLNLANQQPKKK